MYTSGTTVERMIQYISLCEQSMASGEITEIMEDALALIADLQSKLESEREWTSVDTKLPEGMGDVLWYQPEVVSPKGSEYNLKSRAVIANVRPSRKTTHWRPLPAPPTGEQA